MREETSAPGARRLPIPTAEQAGKLPLDTAASLDAVLSPDTAASLGHDIAQRVLQLRDEDLHGREQLTRIIIHSLLSLPDEGLAELVREPVSLGRTLARPRGLAVPDGRSKNPNPRMDQRSTSRRGLGAIRWLDPRRRLVHALGAVDSCSTAAPRGSTRSKKPEGALMTTNDRELDAAEPRS